MVTGTADRTLRIKADGACYTFRIGEFSNEELIKMKMLIKNTLYVLNDEREYLWLKIRQINEVLDRRVNDGSGCKPEPATEIPPPNPLQAGTQI